MERLTYDLRVIWACMKKDIRSALTDRVFTIVSIFLPLNFLILFSLFVISGGLAPTAVVMQDTGPYAQQFYNAMAHANSFVLEKTSLSQAQQLIEQGHIVAVVVIPSNFDTSIEHKQPVQVDVTINNLNTDFTNDIRRAVPFSITKFYAQAFPHVVTITPKEIDSYTHDTGYIPYLSVSILAIALVIGGLLQSGTGTAREWENATIKELLLSPASRWAVVVGKMLGAFIMSLAAIVVVLAVLIFIVGVYPQHWGELIAFTLLTMLIFIAFGTLLGTIIKQRMAFVGLAFGATIPLFFISGAFGPLSFDVPIVQVFAQIFPVYYAIVLLQHAFHNFDLNTYGLWGNTAILVVYALVLVVLAAVVLRRSTVAN